MIEEIIRNKDIIIMALAGTIFYWYLILKEFKPIKKRKK